MPTDDELTSVKILEKTMNLLVLELKDSVEMADDETRSLSTREASFKVADFILKTIKEILSECPRLSFPDLGKVEVAMQNIKDSIESARAAGK